MRLSKLTFFTGCLVGGLGAAFVPLLLTPSHAETKLLPFQGWLTDASGSAIPDGAKIVEFKMYDAPTGGTAKWAGEVHKLSVNGGLVNTMLGSKSSLRDVEFATPTYLQITIDSNGDGQITAADPPLLPRQSVVSSVFAMESLNARNAVKLAGADWTTIMVDAGGNASNEPGSGFLKGSKVQAESITSTQLAINSVDREELADNAVGGEEIEDLSISEQKLTSALKNRLNLGLIPPGTISPYVGDVAPDGWELCHGQEFSRTDPRYSPLEALIGDGRFGLAANPKTHFKLPDFRGYFLRGVDGPDGTKSDRDPDSGESKNGGVDGLRFAMAEGGAVGRRVGSVQKHQLDSHNHNDGNFNRLLRVNGKGTVAAVDDSPKEPQLDSTGHKKTKPAGGNETRPVNAYVHYIIKL